MQDFMNNGSFTAACLKRSYQSKNLFVQLLGMQNVSSYLEKNIKLEVAKIILSIDKCIINQKKLFYINI